MPQSKEIKPRKADRRKESRRWFDNVFSFFAQKIWPDRRKSNRRMGERRSRKS
jgi:hypothetical protein